jgi:hypothetical protein
MPHPGIGAQPVEHGRPRQRRIHDDKVRYLIAIFGRIGVGDHQADVVPDHHERAADPERVTQRMSNAIVRLS